MTSRKPLETVYLVLAIAGTVVPLAAFLPWLAEHGLAPGLFVAELFASRLGAFFAWDVIISAIVIIVAVVASRSLSPPKRAAVIVGTLLVGVSLGLPLLFCFHERARGEIEL